VAAAIELLEAGTAVECSFDDLLRSHPSPAGVAIAFKALERAFPLLGGRCERGRLRVATAFGGPGARAAFEHAAGAEGVRVDPALRRPERGPGLERFVFRITHGDAAVTLLLRDGVLSDEFTRLAFARERTAIQDVRLEVLKPEMAARVLATPAAELFDIG
jgi:hypothetical protein